MGARGVPAGVFARGDARGGASLTARSAPCVVVVRAVPRYRQESRSTAVEPAPVVAQSGRLPHDLKSPTMASRRTGLEPSSARRVPALWVVWSGRGGRRVGSGAVLI